jgi:putative transposase
MAGLDHARTKIADWADNYNAQRPHSVLGYSLRRLTEPTSLQRAIGYASRTSSADRTLLYPRLTA